MKFLSLLNSVGKAFSLFIGLKNPKLKRANRALKCKHNSAIKFEPILPKKILHAQYTLRFPKVPLVPVLLNILPTQSSNEGFKAVLSAPVVGPQIKIFEKISCRFLNRVSVRPVLDAISSCESENLSDLSEEML